MSCPTYVAPPGYQLGAGPTGPVDCTAWAASRAIAHATCGAKVPTGRSIRRHSDEPIPDPASPGLNLSQVAAVALDVFGVYLDVRTGWRALSWGEYETRRKGGAPGVIQVGYGPIADSAYDAGRGFRGGHAIFESQHDTIDSLADGRYPDVYSRDVEGVRVYPRNLMRKAASELIIGRAAGYPIRAGDKVWCAFTADTIPEYRVRVPAPRRKREWRRIRLWHIEDGRIADDPWQVSLTKGFPATCTVPRVFRHPDGTLRHLVKLTNGSREGRWISARWAYPVGAPAAPAITGRFALFRGPVDDLDADDPDEPVPDVRSDPYPLQTDDPVGAED